MVQLPQKRRRPIYSYGVLELRHHYVQCTSVIYYCFRRSPDPVKQETGEGRGTEGRAKDGKREDGVEQARWEGDVEVIDGRGGDRKRRMVRGKI